MKIIVATYFGRLGGQLASFLRLPVQALHVDLVRAPEELEALVRGLPADRILSAGVVDGRNVWRTRFSVVRPLLERAAALLGPERLFLAPSCSLVHVPITLRHESRLDSALKVRLAFAEEKLSELVALREMITGKVQSSPPTANPDPSATFGRGGPAVRPNYNPIGGDGTGSNHRSPFEVRQAHQRARLRLPQFPTTTIGSFPQTPELRAARAHWRKGEMSSVEYERRLEAETAACIRFQEEVGLDVLVHGEFERNDMVEYFAERLDGYAFTTDGWVQSFGSRYVKPPILYGDVARQKPMTVRWAAFAQSLTARPVKGMLTGPITMLQWSFVRDDQPRRETAWQIARALREEVLELEAAGILVIQIDEPALREGLPLRREDQADYLSWAVEAFHLCTGGVRDETQIHTHMCYAEFNDIIESIAALDADVITIEASRSGMELLRAFVDFRYPNEIGPGVYDIHSPRVPSVAEMRDFLARAATVLPPRNLWVNPDCGLKTREWPEVRAALGNLVEAARQIRATVKIRPTRPGIGERQNDG